MNQSAPDPPTDNVPILEALETITQADRESARATLHQAIDAIFLSDAPTATGALIRAVQSALFSLSLVLGTGIIHLSLAQSVKGKARPRLGGRRGGQRAFMPQDYVDWMEEAGLDFFAQWRRLGQLGPMQQVHRLVIRFLGGDRGVDTDNGAGSVMDALVKAGLIREDNMTVVPWLDVKWEPTLKGVAPSIEIYLDPSDTPHARHLTKPKKPTTTKPRKPRKGVKPPDTPDSDATPIVVAATVTSGTRPRFVANAPNTGGDTP